MLEKLMNPAAAQNLLQEAFGCPVPGLSLGEVIVRDTSWSVQYRAEVSGKGYLLSALRCPNGSLEKDAARVRRQAAQERPDLERFIVERPDLELLICPFPLDPRIAHLPQAADPGAVSRVFLRDAPELLDGPAQGGGGELSTLRYVPRKRCQFRYVFPLAEAQPARYLGKVFSDQRGRVLSGDMNAVAEAYAAHGDPCLTAPRALAFIPGLAMLVQEWLPGVTLYERLHARSAEVEHIRAAARSIAVLHTSAVAPARNHAVQDELRVVEGVSDRLISAGFSIPGQSSVLESLHRMTDGLGHTRAVPVHRDFYDKQLLVHRSRTALIDLDTLALGPPEIDVANFVAHLTLRSLQGVISEGQATHWRRSFLEEYARAGCALDRELFEFFLAATYFRQACRYRVRRDGEALGGELISLAGAALRRERYVKGGHAA